jgi:LysM repeat protein
VYISALTRDVQVTALLGPNGFKLTAGYGKWEEVAVPRGVPFTQWDGRNLWAADIDLLLDGWSRQASVESDITQIEYMALRPGVQPMGEPLATPPPVRITGAISHPEFTWVITGIDWGDALRAFEGGHRLRQGLTLHLLEYVEETTISALPPPPPPPRKYKVVKGDNLKKLAVKFLGKSSRWPDIVKVNNGMRGWQLGDKWVGKTIRIPGQ